MTEDFLVTLDTECHALFSHDIITPYRPSYRHGPYYTVQTRLQAWALLHHTDPVTGMGPITHTPGSVTCRPHQYHFKARSPARLEAPHLPTRTLKLYVWLGIQHIHLYTPLPPPRPQYVRPISLWARKVITPAPRACLDKNRFLTCWDLRCGGVTVHQDHVSIWLLLIC